VPPQYKLICGVSLGHASEHPVNRYDPGRMAAGELQLRSQTVR
jgi:hypothetical protein